MKNLRKTISTILVTGALVASLVVPAYADTYEYGGNSDEYIPGAGAAEYDFDGESAGANFYQSTSTNGNYIADNGQIVVGTDGTVSGGVSGNPSNEPSTMFDLPVGVYPEAYGFQTDVAIANNSVFPNELGPTTQNANYYTPWFVPAVSSGALPTGYYYGQSAFGYPSRTVFGLATAFAPMPTINSKGAIARLCIPSVGLDKYVYEGITTANMQKGIAHFDCTAGWGGNIGLAGHNRGNHPHFEALKDVKIGDIVTYTTAYGTNTYVVSNILTVSVNDTSGLQQNGYNQLTMYTCKANQPEVKLCVVATLIGSTAA